MAQLMDALVKPVAGPGLELRQVPIPEPGPGEVLIKVHKTAICGTDVHIYNWDPWAQDHIKPPMTIGHEYVGEIAKLGAGVTVTEMVSSRALVYKDKKIRFTAVGYGIPATDSIDLELEGKWQTTKHGVQLVIEHFAEIIPPSEMLSGRVNPPRER